VKLLPRRTTVLKPPAGVPVVGLRPVTAGVEALVKVNWSADEVEEGPAVGSVIVMWICAEASAAERWR
jgi:hypothetical protein